MVTVRLAMRDGGRAGSVVWLSLGALGSVSGATPLPRPTIHSLQSDTSITGGRGGGLRERETPVLMELISADHLMDSWRCYSLIRLDLVK